MRDMINNGTKVEVLDSGIIGVVTGICVRGVENQAVQYEVQWLNGGSLNCIWLEEYLVKVFEETKQKAGMVNYETGLSTQ